MRRTVLSIILAAMLGFQAIGLSACGGPGQLKPLRIGVLLPLAGDRPLAWEDLFHWAVEDINRGLAGAGYRVELVYRNTFGEDIVDQAKSLAGDPSIGVTIGPMTSGEALLAAPVFIRSRKLLISPSATADELFRAFKGKGYFARTCQSDVGQVKTLMETAVQNGARKVSLLYENSIYGRSYAYWSGFFSKEMNLDFGEAVGFVSGQQSFTEAVARSTGDGTDCVITAAFAHDAATIRRALEASGSGATPLFSDAAATPTLISILGGNAEGLRGVAPSVEPTSGFTSYYSEEFGAEPPPYAAETYDALLLACEVLARRVASGGGEDLSASFNEITRRGPMPIGFSSRNEGRAIRDILKGASVHLEGATGPLYYDTEYGVDPLTAFYSRWMVEDGEFKSTASVSSTGSIPVAATTSAAGLSSLESDVRYSGYEPGDRDELWAVIVATNGGIEEYRRQSDALSIYQVLKANGVSDERIILFMADDVSQDSGNPDPGVVRNRIGGPNLRYGAMVDYSGEDVTERKLKGALEGRADNGGPVLKSDEADDVLVYISGEAADGAIMFDNGDRLTASELGSLTARMSKRGRYRRLMYLLEASDGEAVGSRVVSPGALVMAATSRGEASIPADYDSRMHVWLADQFTHTFTETVTRTANSAYLPIAQVYAEVYLQTMGAHEVLMNISNFGDVRRISIAEFITP